MKFFHAIAFAVSKTCFASPEVLLTLYIGFFLIKLIPEYSFSSASGIFIHPYLK